MVFPNNAKRTVPKLLLTLVNMVLEGPSIKDQMEEATSPAALTIAQLLKFNSVRHKRAPDTAAFVRHSTAQETPVPLYIGLMLHAHTSKRELVDKMAHLGLSVSYDCVFQLSTQMGNHVCQQFHREQVVCPPQLRGHVFTTAAVDNIDHNPSSTTARDSFHGTAMSLIQHPIVQEDKQLVVTSDMEVLSKPPLPDRSSIAPCTHEEADSRMLLHVAHAARNGHHKIMIQTVDTDVVVLAVTVAQTLQPEDELWLAFGNGKNFRYLAAHEIAAGLGPEKARALPVFHALTGCDTVSSFVDHGKKTAWAVWAVFPELTHTLLKLSYDISQEVMATIERLIILLYDRTSTCTEINTARRKLFAKRHNAESIPPTKAALEEQVKRAVYQGGHMWGLN